MADAQAQPGRQPLAPAQRRRLQQLFEHGSKVGATGNFDYATDLFTQCVVGDPGNPIYVRSFLANLQKKYNNNKKGSKLSGLKTAGAKATIKKCALQKDWLGVITNGLEVLKLNPWDSSACQEIGRACEQLEHDDCQLEFLRMAYEGSPDDVDVNRVLARALGRTGHFDEAIAAWDRVRKAKPGDEEATRSISNLSVEKTIKKGGYEEAETTKDVRAKKLSTHDDGEHALSPVERLERDLERDPNDMEKYIELSELHLRDERFDEAEKALSRGLQASGGDLQIRERLEDVQLRRARVQLDVAEKKARAERTEPAIKLYNDLKAELTNKEIEVYSSRCERYPANLGYKYELAVRLQRAKKFSEAIKLFQETRSDLKRKGQVFFHLGSCFTHIRQHRLALENFEKASEELSERDMDLKKESMYNAARVAVHIKEYDKGEKYFSTLAGLDFGYRDVAQWLDKLARLREDGEEIVEE